MKLAAFDLEIAKMMPDGVRDWRTFAPLGITCAAVALGDAPDPIVWQGVPQLTQAESQQLVRDLEALVGQGYCLLTWNGCSFDFGVLAVESGLYDECAALAMGHIDLMLRVTFEKGHFLSLQKALDGARLTGKLKKVQLSDGTVLTDMAGAKAPEMWAAGEHQAVLAYLRQDVLQLLELARVVQQEKAIRWTSSKGTPQSVRIDRLITVQECFALPEPDVSWMTDPPTRQQFIRWMTQPTLPQVSNLREGER
jgi:hypothetical protein